MVELVGGGSDVNGDTPYIFSVLVLLLASVERFGVSRMRDFCLCSLEKSKYKYLIYWFYVFCFYLDKLSQVSPVLDPICIDNDHMTNVNYAKKNDVSLYCTNGVDVN